MNGQNAQHKTTSTALTSNTFVQQWSPKDGRNYHSVQKSSHERLTLKYERRNRRDSERKRDAWHKATIR